MRVIAKSNRLQRVKMIVSSCDNVENVFMKKNPFGKVHCSLVLQCTHDQWYYIDDIISIFGGDMQGHEYSILRYHRNARICTVYCDEKFRKNFIL